MHNFNESLNLYWVIMSIFLWKVLSRLYSFDKNKSTSSIYSIFIVYLEKNLSTHLINCARDTFSIISWKILLLKAHFKCHDWNISFKFKRFTPQLIAGQFTWRICQSWLISQAYKSIATSSFLEAVYLGRNSSDLLTSAILS